MKREIEQIISTIYKLLDQLSPLYGEGMDEIVFATEYALKLAIDLLVAMKSRRYIFFREGSIKMKLRRINREINKVLLPSRE